MATKSDSVKPSDLPNKRVRSSDGTFVTLKVVQSDSASLPYDLLAAFRSNVRRLTDERRARANVGKHDNTFPPQS